MRIYKIIAFVIVFQFVFGGITASGIFDATISGQSISITQADVEEVTDIAQNIDNVNVLFAISVGWRMFSVFARMAWTAVTIIPILTEFGVPVYIAAMVQGPIWLVYLWGIIQFLGNKSSKSMA